jgi:argininosuccinate synthase
MTQTILLAYAGSLDDSAAIAWLRDRHQAEVVTLTLDVGQGRDVEHVRARALACGAARAHTIDAREEFSRDCALPWLQADAIDEPGLASLVRPLIARKLVEMTRSERGSTAPYAVAHGAADDGLDLAVAAIDAGLAVVAPSRERRLDGIDALEYARAKGLMIPPALEPAPHLLRRHAAPPAAAPETAANLEIAFEDGVPRAVNGVTFPLTELLESLSVIAGQHLVGRVGAIDAPAALVLRAAYGVVGRQTGIVRLKLHKGQQSLVGRVLSDPSGLVTA